MKRLFFYNVVLFLIITLSCLTVKAGTNQNTSDPVLKWEFTSLGEDANGMPSTKLSLLVDDAKYEIQTESGNIFEITPIDFKSYKIPKSALLACESWWAGGGTNYWVIKKDNSLVVMRKEIEEGSPEHPGDYVSKPKKVLTIPLK